MRPGNVGRHTPRNELLDHGLAGATHETERGVGEDQARPTLLAGIVRVRQRRRTHASEQVRVIGHRLAAVAARGERVAQRVTQTRSRRAGSLVEITRVLVEERGDT